MPDVGGEVEADIPALDRGQVFGEGGEVPGDARLQGGDIHVLDVLQRAGDQITMLGVGGRNGEAAVPATTVVTPWKHDGVSAGSQKTWAS